MFTLPPIRTIRRLSLPLPPLPYATNLQLVPTLQNGVATHISRKTWLCRQVLRLSFGWVVFRTPPTVCYWMPKIVPGGCVVSPLAWLCARTTSLGPRLPTKATLQTQRGGIIMYPRFMPKTRAVLRGPLLATLHPRPTIWKTNFRHWLKIRMSTLFLVSILILVFPFVIGIAPGKAWVRSRNAR